MCDCGQMAESTVRAPQRRGRASHRPGGSGSRLTAIFRRGKAHYLPAVRPSQAPEIPPDKPFATLTVAAPLAYTIGMDLRLFPLQTVLFPGMRMPLHIFEERYRIMIGECIEEDVPFGVVLIKSGVEVGGGSTPHSIGTTARIQQVEHLEDGRMNLFTVGEHRFRIVTLNTTQPYLRGEVAYVEQQQADDAARAVMSHAQELFDEYLKTYLAIGNQWTRGAFLPEDPGEAGDYIATRMDIPAEAKQELLEMLSPAPRLRRELEIIAEALPDMRLRLVAHLRQQTAGFAVLN